MAPSPNDSELPVGEGRVKFSIFLRRDGILSELFAINRTPSGLFFNPTHNGWGTSNGGSTYHESGLRWDKGLLDRNSLKIRDMPLHDFQGLGGQPHVAASVKRAAGIRGELD